MTGAHAVAVDSTHVYFTIATDDGALLRAPKTGGPAELIAKVLGRPRRIALHGDHVYVTSPMLGRVHRIAKDGSQAEILFQGAPFPRGIAVNDDALVWVRSSAASGELLRLNHGASVPDPLTSELAGPEAVVLDGPFAFVLDNGSGTVEPSVRRVQLTSGNVQTLMQLGAANGQDIDVHDGWLHFSMNAQVWRLRTNGSESVVIGKGAFVRGVRASDAGVYWAERGADVASGQIVRWRDGVIDVLASGQREPEGVALDADCVYWANDGGLSDRGSIWAAPL